jgi:hypothetical protein
MLVLRLKETSRQSDSTPAYISWPESKPQPRGRTNSAKMYVMPGSFVLVTRLWPEDILQCPASTPDVSKVSRVDWDGKLIVAKPTCCGQRELQRRSRSWQSSFCFRFGASDFEHPFQYMENVAVKEHVERNTAAHSTESTPIASEFTGRNVAIWRH